ncbi:MAG: hypothetical protein J2P37_18345, partial [Ktedonobacteraceae bacterium]|nr:hypothetical protein [Ktedonobacteraceae bacterium]
MESTRSVGDEPATLCIPTTNAGPLVQTANDESLVQTANDADASGYAQAVCKESAASPCGQGLGK